jgi:hypothetical protein
MAYSHTVRGRRVTLVTAAVIALAAIVWLLPLALTAGHSGRLSAAEMLKARNDVRTVLVTLVAAIAAAVGLTFTARTYLLNVSGQVTDRYSKAVGQLGEPEIAVRVGAVYALERVARDSPRDVDTIVEVLCTFVRAACPLPADDPPPDAVVAADVQAAVNVLGRAPLCDHRVPADLRRANLRGVDMTNATFAGVWLRDSLLAKAQLRGANLRGAWLSGARLDGADLDSADLEGARLRGAMLDGAVLKGARLVGATLDEVSFKGTWLSGAHLTRDQLSTGQRAEASGVRHIRWHG